MRITYSFSAAQCRAYPRTGGPDSARVELVFENGCDTGIVHLSEELARFMIEQIAIALDRVRREKEHYAAK